MYKRQILSNIKKGRAHASYAGKIAIIICCKYPPPLIINKSTKKKKATTTKTFWTTLSKHSEDDDEHTSYRNKNKYVVSGYTNIYSILKEKRWLRSSCSCCLTQIQHLLYDRRNPIKRILKQHTHKYIYTHTHLYRYLNVICTCLSCIISISCYMFLFQYILSLLWLNLEEAWTI